MAIMTATRTLRDAPFGASLGIEAVAGVRVRIVDAATTPFWTRIELIESTIDPKPQGWVSAQAVNADADAIGPLDKVIFARECVFEGGSFGVLAHYLMAVAQMRTNVTDGPQSGDADYGPFALSTAEWDLFGSLEEFDFNMSAENYRNWTAQCMVFAAMTNVMQRKLAGLLANQPTAAQMALAQMIGTEASFRSIRAPEKPVMDVVAAVTDDLLSAEAIDRTRLPLRYKDYLDGKTGEEVLSAITAALQTSLDETRSVIAGAGAQPIEFPSGPVGEATSSSDFVTAKLTAPKTVTYTAADGSVMVRKGGSIAWRQNNPGNIRPGNFSTTHGAIGEAGNFAIFPSESVGFDAILQLLSGPSYRDLTLEKAMLKYAPPEDSNNTEQYIVAIVSQTGIARDRVVSGMSREELTAFGKAIQKHEGWTVGSETFTPGPDGAVSGLGVTADAIVLAATQEWERWGKSTWNTITGAKAIGKTETSPGFADFVYETYYKTVVKSPDPTKKAKMLRRIQELDTPTYPWSAITISYIMKTAGFTKAQFEFSEGHSRYIRNAVAAKGVDTAASYWGFRITDAVPTVGDLVGCARNSNGTPVSHAAGQAWYDKTGDYSSHADIVVAVRPGEIDVIGGNVSNSVTMKTLKCDPVSGKLTDMSHPWFVVMKRRLPAPS
ncbi:uncharacterized protein DUF2272 [Hoeflea marina]|uniref:Uncharacterized protein DUF2272 n=1 Tax=Hoeflea marina TaxID=274592 RepID=A0A317PJ13_9HYPH|nr:DUF2272 domain-containing protein [Hoeflea marina]PWV99207.1 uncharacterized protein DUF2272 [Hoeflea marina]